MSWKDVCMRTDNALTREVLSMTNIGRQDKTCSTKRFHAACHKCRPSTLFPLFFCFSLCDVFFPRYEHVRVTRAACITWYANRRKRRNLARYTLLYNIFVMYLYVFGEVGKKSLSVEDANFTVGVVIPTQRWPLGSPWFIAIYWIGTKVRSAMNFKT